MTDDSTGDYYLVCKFDGRVPIVTLCVLANGADRRTARRLRAVESQRFTVLTAHQRLKTLFDHCVEFAALQLGSRHQVMIFSQLHLCQKNQPHYTRIHHNDIVKRQTVKFLKKYKEANDNNIVCQACSRY